MSRMLLIVIPGQLLQIHYSEFRFLMWADCYRFCGILAGLAESDIELMQESIAGDVIDTWLALRGDKRLFGND